MLCGVLNDTFSKTYNLKAHQCVHTGELLYCCDGCNEIFSKSYNLKVHTGVTNGERPNCCDLLIKHLAKQTVLRNIRVYTLLSVHITVIW